MSTIVQNELTELYEIRSNMKFEFLKNMRSKRIYMIFGLPIVIGLLFYIVPKLTNTSYPANAISYITSVIGFTDIIIVFLALFLGADAINREHSDQTDLLIFPLPQRRSNVIFAKYLMQLLTAWAGLLVFYSLIAGGTAVIYGTNQIPKELLTSFFASMLYMSTVLAFAFFLSAIFRSTTTSMVLTFFGVQLLLPITGLLLGLANINTNWIFTNHSSIIQDVMGISSRDFGGTTSTFGQSVQILWLNSLVLLLLSIFFGIRKEVGS